MSELFTPEIRIGHYVRGGSQSVAHTVKGSNKRHGGIVTYCGARIERPSYDIPRGWADCQSCRWERDR